MKGLPELKPWMVIITTGAGVDAAPTGAVNFQVAPTGPTLGTRADGQTYTRNPKWNCRAFRTENEYVYDVISNCVIGDVLEFHNLLLDGVNAEVKRQMRQFPTFLGQIMVGPDTRVIVRSLRPRVYGEPTPDVEVVPDPELGKGPIPPASPVPSSVAGRGGDGAGLRGPSDEDRLDVTTE